MIKIFKGDDTDFLGNALRLTVDVPDLDLTGCRLELSFLGIVRSVPCESSNVFLLALTAAETAALPLGVHFAALRLYDPQGRRFTLSNTVKVKVTDCVADAYETQATISDLTVTIPQVMAGQTYDIGGTNGDTRAFLAKLAEALGATVVDSEGGVQ